jgi:hypothetical protein
MTELPELLVLIRTIVFVVAPLFACGICLFGMLILFGMPALVAGALRAKAGMKSKVGDDYHRRDFMQQ